MKCDIEGCIHKAKWIVDDNGVDAYLCPIHHEEFHELQKKMKEEMQNLELEWNRLWDEKRAMEMEL